MSKHPTYNLICILGPTASGKTVFAANLANELDGEIISADSRQVYRGMNLGTGKDYNDYKIGDIRVPYHLIDIAEAGEEYNIFRYQEDFQRAYQDIIARKKFPILCGGTGMYIEAVIKDYHLQHVPVNEALRKKLQTLDDESLVEILKSFKNPHNTTDTLIHERLVRAIEIEEFMKDHPPSSSNNSEINALFFGLHIDRESRREKITQRLQLRLQQGMIEEVQGLINSGIPREKLEFYGLEYKYISRYVQGIISYDEMHSSLNIAIHQFAKRQMTWFRKMEKQGTQINWIEASLSLEDKIAQAKEILARNIKMI